MKLATVKRLADLNREFYEQHAEAFADSRPRLHLGVKRVLAQIPAGVRVLELGCGDGKVARWMEANATPAFYLGLDSSEAMLERARRVTSDGWRGAGNPPSLVTHHSSLLTFALADLNSPVWPRVLPSDPFDWILAFAVFHHLPGFSTRAQILRTLAERLSPGGTVVMSNWQFLRSERLKQRIVPWSALNLKESEVEPGDYLLSWERSNRRGLRYVHVLDELEMRRMAEAAGLLEVVEIFRSDGVTGDLADYALMHKSG
jgi:tRNA (uracil-5-)-methyltransferase TRM9